MKHYDPYLYEHQIAAAAAEVLVDPVFGHSPKVSKPQADAVRDKPDNNAGSTSATPKSLPPSN